MRPGSKYLISVNLPEEVQIEQLENLYGERPVIFVFGSNLAGRHGKGAALHAFKNYDARGGVGEGLTGRAYAIPTKDQHMRPRSLPDVADSVRMFLTFARQAPELDFKVTRVGCGLAGFIDEQIVPLFQGASPNCGFDPEWARFGMRPWTALGIK